MCLLDTDRRRRHLTIEPVLGATYSRIGVDVASCASPAPIGAYDPELIQL